MLTARLTILIAEDEERIAAFLEKGMRAEGWVTVTVHDDAPAGTCRPLTVIDVPPAAAVVRRPRRGREP